MSSVEDNKILELFEKPTSRSRAFQMLVSKYQERVYWIIRRMLLNHEDTNDVMQETFIKVWQNLPGFRRESGLYSWIYRIAVNQVYNYLRKRKQVRTIQTTGLTDEMIHTLREDPFFDGDQAQVKLQKAILKLPHKQQMVFNLRYYENLQYDEMAEVLDTSVGSLKASYHWAVKKIESYLKSN